jgi:hypothetical protein
MNCRCCGDLAVLARDRSKDPLICQRQRLVANTSLFPDRNLPLGVIAKD